jgi:hypothetical protein
MVLIREAHATGVPGGSSWISAKSAVSTRPPTSSLSARMAAGASGDHTSMTSFVSKDNKTSVFIASHQGSIVMDDEGIHLLPDKKKPEKKQSEKKTPPKKKGKS